MAVLVKSLISIGALGAAIGTYYSFLPKTIGDKLSKERLVFLDMTDEGTVDLDAWKQRVTEHNKTNPAPNKAKIVGLDLNATGDQSENTNISAFKKKCRDLIALSLSDSDASTREQEVRDWCLKNESH